MSSSKLRSGTWVAAFALALFACGSSDDDARGTAPDPTDLTTQDDAGSTDRPPFDVDDSGSSTDTDASTDDASPDTDASDDDGEPLPEFSDPITLEPDDYDKWIWIPIPEMKCADDTPAGVGVNFTKRSRNLVVWFQGGGVCYDLKSCTMFKDLMVGMGPDPMAHLGVGTTGLFNRGDETNPFRDDNFVVLPHCAVDAHSADKDSTYPPLPTYHQHGYRNATEVLRHVVPTFKDASRVVIAGFSAGGIGTMANYHKFAKAFESLGHPAPFLINDAGPLFRPPFLSQAARDALRKGWGHDDTIFKMCPTCKTEGYHEAYRRLAELHPGLRSSQICSYADGVAAPLYMMLNYDPTVMTGKFKNGLLDLAKWTDSYQYLSPATQHRVFYYPGDRHGAIVLPYTETPGLLKFLNEQLNGLSSWSNVIQ